jgi:hypothetical protein
VADAGGEDEQAAVDAEVASAKGGKKGAKGAAVERLSAAGSGGPTVVREVGFKQLPGISRLFVRTGATPQYTVQEVDERTLRVELANVRATRKNDLRLLDTSFFASAVQSVKPSQVGGNYVLEVKLRERVPYEQKVEGDLLTIDFQRPTATAAAAPGKRAASPASDEAAEETP